MRRAVKATLANTALVIVSVLLPFLALEAGLRAYHNEWRDRNFRYSVDLAEERHPFAFDPKLGWVPVPGFRGDGLTILADGTRSNGTTGFLGSAEPILAISDSFTFGYGVSDWETWPAQLQQLSHRRVVNAGVNGYGIDQAFLRTQRILSQSRFKTVIFSFIPDDLRRCQMSVSFWET